MKKAWVVLIALLAILGILYVAIFTDVLKIQSISFTESENFDALDFKQYSGIQVGDYYFEVDSYRAAEGLKKHPFVKDAVVEKVFPNQIVADIEYRTHFVSLTYLDFTLSLDDEMVVLGVLTEETPGFVIQGFPYDGFTAGSVIRVERSYALSNMVTLIKLFTVANLEPEKTIRYVNNSILFKIDGITVDFGLGDDAVERFNAFVPIYEDLKANGTTSGTIDLSTSGFSIYRPFDE